MTEILYEFIDVFGLNYQPTTFPELFTWLVLVMTACSILSGVIRILLTLPLQLHKGVH